MISMRRMPIVFFALSIVVYANPLEIQKDMSFVAARAMLLKAKWKPFNVHEHDDYALMGVEHELAKRNFKEFDSCSVDYSNCVMRYKRGDECFTLYTIGEKIKDMRVVQWSDECPAIQGQGQNASTRSVLPERDRARRN